MHKPPVWIWNIVHIPWTKTTTKIYAVLVKSALTKYWTLRDTRQSFNLILSYPREKNLTWLREKGTLTLAAVWRIEWVATQTGTLVTTSSSRLLKGRKSLGVMSMALRLDLYTTTKMMESINHSPITTLAIPRGGSKGTADGTTTITACGDELRRGDIYPAGTYKH